MNEITPFRYDEYLTVVEANELIRSKQDNLTLLETKLIRLCISQVLKNDTDFRTYQCQLTELARYLNMKPSNACAEIEELTKEIIKKSIFIKDKTPNKRGEYNYKAFNWVEYIEYKDGLLTIQLSRHLKPYLLGLDKLFTTYGYDAILGLSTSNSVRLYELLCSYVYIKHNNININNNNDIPVGEKEIAFSTEYLRQYFNCEKKYPQTGDFIKRIVEPCVKAINTKTLMRVKYRKVISKCAITHLVFEYLSFEEYAQLTNPQ